MNKLTRLNGLQKQLIETILKWVATDYREFDDFGAEGIVALRVMCYGKDDENLPHLVNQYIKKLLKEKGE